MAEGGGFEPPEGVNLLRFSRTPQSAALPSLRRPISWRHENGGASGTRTHVAAVQRRSSPAELWPRENHGRSGGDRTRGHLLPKQVRYLCATLRCPCPVKPRHARPGRGKSQGPPARCRRPRPRWQPFCLASAQTIAAPVPATTGGYFQNGKYRVLWSLPVRGG